jgi:translation elongation factor EF-Tu-like GTPase
MIIDDVFQIAGRGVVASGQIQSEKIEVGQKIIVDPEYLPEFESEITGIETFHKRKNLKIAHQNDMAAIILRGVEKNKLKKKMKIYSI